MKNLILLLLLITTPISAAQQPLPVDQAFQFSAKIHDPNTLLTQWKIAPGYFLYRARFKFTLKDINHAELGHITLPIGIAKQDIDLGEYQIFRRRVRIPIPILGKKAKQTELLVTYQGCADSGFCYPPTSKKLTLTINKKFALAKLNVKTTQLTIPKQLAKANHLLASHNLLFILLGFFGFGLLLSFTPCVLPMIPILSGIIIGHGKDLTTSKAFRLSLIYVLSMSFTYAMIGVVVALLGKNIQIMLQNPWVLSVSSLVFVLLALSMFGFYDLRIPDSIEGAIAKVSHKQKSGSYFGVVIMGILATLIVSPCVTAPLVGALGYIGQTGDVFFGAAALFTLSLGMGAPLLVIGTSAGTLLPKAGMWMNAVKSFFGVLLLALAIYLISRVIPEQITMFLWASLLIVSSIFMGALKRKLDSGWGKLWKGVGLIIFVYGITLIIGAGLGNTNPLHPLAGLKLSATAAKRELTFKPVKTIADVKREVMSANLVNKPVMLDFYADWCVSCKVIARTTFKDPRVVNSLSEFVLLKADVTANDASDIALEKYFNVVAPPTFVFFDRAGSEIKSATLVGEVNTKVFLKILNTIVD